MFILYFTHIIAHSLLAEVPQDEKIYEIEMAMDKEIEEEMMSQMMPDVFGSFRYPGEHTGSGHPLSMLYLFILFLVAIFSIFIISFVVDYTLNFIRDFSQKRYHVAGADHCQAKQRTFTNFPHFVNLALFILFFPLLCLSLLKPLHRGSYQIFWTKGSNASWKDPSRRKSLFDDLAKEKGFDALVPKNWYIVPSDINHRMVSSPPLLPLLLTPPLLISLYFLT